METEKRNREQERYQTGPWCLESVESGILEGDKVVLTKNGEFIDEDPKTYQEALNSVESIRTLYDASKHLKKNKGDSVSQFEYAKIIGGVMYLMNYTRPDIANAVSRLSRYKHNPDKYHWDALRHLLRSLKGKINYCFHFNKFPTVLEGYCEANWVIDNDGVNSTSGSTMEYEFIALELVGQEVKWIKSLLGDVPLWGTCVSVSIQCDSQAAIAATPSPSFNFFFFSVQHTTAAASNFLLLLRRPAVAYRRASFRPPHSREVQPLRDLCLIITPVDPPTRSVFVCKVRQPCVVEHDLRRVFSLPLSVNCRTSQSLSVLRPSRPRKT
ncbi:ty1-copia retrotransposon protein [Cucumis melo var. makuwa]|uniref:Ty1-copia retrotransposon protein n=1 Tax=Cucumis melo var. makuwa TaxID=1194695 RepID=A0A5A7UMV1_CUCMM|nr:ty1-copia retrotransposon protein [Cucumis melo var. makuwa]TYK22744.1 ty1-copia retrotransposon protein [Cucumis melo var. makuwa]